MARGGARAGAGRPKGKGKYGESTKPIRIPESLVESILRLVEKGGARLPLYVHATNATLPDDKSILHLDMNDLLIGNAKSTFLVKVDGTALQSLSVHSGDTLVVDRKLSPLAGKLGVARTGNQLKVGVLAQQGDQWSLAVPGTQSPILLKEEQATELLGVVTFVVHSR